MALELRETGNGITVQSNGEEVGLMSLMRGEGKEYIAIVELYVEKVLTLPNHSNVYKAISKFPGIDRDISSVVDQSKKVGEIITAILKMQLKMLRDVLFVDQFEDIKKIGKDKKSVTLRLSFQSAERTLIDAEIDALVLKIIAELKSSFGAEIR